MQPAGGARAPGPEKFPADPGDPAGIDAVTRTTVTTATVDRLVSKRFPADRRC